MKANLSGSEIKKRNHIYMSQAWNIDDPGGQATARLWILDAEACSAAFQSERNIVSLFPLYMFLIHLLTSDLFGTGTPRHL